MARRPRQTRIDEQPKDLNPLCLGCERACKQSAVVEVLACPAYVRHEVPSRVEPARVVKP